MDPYDVLQESVEDYHRDLCERGQATEASARLVHEVKKLREQPTRERFLNVLGLMHRSGYLKWKSK